MLLADGIAEPVGTALVATDGIAFGVGTPLNVGAPVAVDAALGATAGFAFGCGATDSDRGGTLEGTAISGAGR